MSSYKCEYHPSMEATAKCEKCGKMICLQCKKIYHKRLTESHGIGEDEHRHTYVTNHEYCPICYYDTITNDSTGPAAIACAINVIFIAFIILAVMSSTFTNIGITPGGSSTSYTTVVIGGVTHTDVIVGTSVNTGMEIGGAIQLFQALFILAILGVIGYGIYYLTVLGPQKANDARTKKEEFLREISSGETSQQNLSVSYPSSDTGQSTTKVNCCTFCGTILKPSDQKCPNCGTIIEKEYKREVKA